MLLSIDVLRSMSGLSFPDRRIQLRFWIELVILYVTSITLGRRSLGSTREAHNVLCVNRSQKPLRMWSRLRIECWRIWILERHFPQCSGYTLQQGYPEVAVKPSGALSVPEGQVRCNLSTCYKSLVICWIGLKGIRYLHSKLYQSSVVSWKPCLRQLWL